jgi:aminoglycoside 3-N-acetyltransferase
MPTTINPAVSFRDLANGLRELQLERARPVIVHASLSAFGEVRGGAETLLGALTSVVETVVVPTFTYKTMLTPEDGPANNAMDYGKGRDQNRMAEFFQPDMPADPLMGALPEALRRRPEALLSSHPILSFSGIRARQAIECQTLTDPLAPIGFLAQQGGWVLLLGVDHRANTSIHYAEKLAGRKQFTRWALTPAGACECPAFPGCSNGFHALGDCLVGLARQTVIGGALVQAIPLPEMIDVVQAMIAEDPRALLCGDPACERCAAVRHSLND